MTSVLNLCVLCVRYRGDLKCEAFPDGIPAPIVDLDWDHRKHFPGDGDVLFVAKTDSTTQELLRELFGVAPGGE